MSASALYRGYLYHRRLEPRLHAFRYPLFMVYLDLAEVEQALRPRWLWRVGTKGFAVARFCRTDHFGDPEVPLATCVRNQIEDTLGRRPTGPVRLLTHLRYWGYCFNPISVYYCFAEDGVTLDAWLLEVTNTPWGERQCYVLDARGAEATVSFAKTLHVSPFMPMALRYTWRGPAPAAHLRAHINVFRGDALQFSAALALERRPLTLQSGVATLARFPWMTARVIAAIYGQALWLWLKGIPVPPPPPSPSCAASS
ncbi:MAG: DUF1365 domain-containing protein [Candidatus Competibacterales bacterium]